ncbi:MAG: histidine kinase, partial [Phycisphaerales bacterium]
GSLSIPIARKGGESCSNRIHVGYSIGARSGKNGARSLLAVGAVIVAFWALQAIIPIAQRLAAERASESVPVGAVVLQLALPCALWALLTPWIMYAARRFPFSRSRVVRPLGTHILLSVLTAFVFSAMYAPLSVLVFGDTLAWERVVGRGSNWLAQRFLLDVHVYWFTLLAVTAYRIARDLRDRNLQAARLSAQLADARLAALQMQIHPHFLFNTLGAIAALARDGNGEKASDMATRLGRLLRRVLDRDGDGVVPLAEEIEFVEEYLDIEQVRFGKRLRVDLDIAPETLEAAVPFLMLQPLAENAVKYGVAPNPTGGAIRLRTTRTGDALGIEIRNTEGKSSRNGNGLGVGVPNVGERLRQLYGDHHAFELCHADGTEAVVRISIPFRRIGEDGE